MASASHGSTSDEPSRGPDCRWDGGGGCGDAHKLTAASILYAGEASNRVLNKAVQVHGGSGYIWESEINRLFRCIKILEIGAGTSEVRKMIIAEELLRG